MSKPKMVTESVDEFAERVRKWLSEVADADDVQMFAAHFFNENDWTRIEVDPESDTISYPAEHWIEA
tara:strand:+ start:1047 stop:1247 length:201 start_codon:yes stop_codon:yes gene_type:complete